MHGRYWGIKGYPGVKGSSEDACLNQFITYG